VGGVYCEVQAAHPPATPFFAVRQRVCAMSASPTQPIFGVPDVTQLPSPGVGAVNCTPTLLSTKYVREESVDCRPALSVARAATVTWSPSGLPDRSIVAAYGALVSVATTAPSSRKSTRATPQLSPALAPTSTPLRKRVSCAGPLKATLGAPTSE
jgi:hypothetical protein